MAGLASLGINKLLENVRRNQFVILICIIVFAIITNLIVIMAGIGGIRSRDRSVYMTQGESQAFEWLDNNIEKDAVILAGPDTGLLIPVYTGRRVLYGHPFETVDANTKLHEVKNYFNNPDIIDSEGLLSKVNYVFVGPRERELSSNGFQLDLQVIYDEMGVTIFSVTR